MIEISSNNYMNWLNSKDKGSIIYIEFGSYYVISTQLMEGIGDGLLKCGRLFLWAIREGQYGYKMEDMLGCKEELEIRGNSELVLTKGSS